MSTELEWLAAAVGDQASALLPHLQAVILADGQLLLEDGVPNGWLHLLVEGRLVVTYAGADGREVELAVREPGAWLGEVGVLDGGPATATVRARGPGRALRLSKEGLERLTVDEPKAAAALLRYLARTMAHRIAESSAGRIESLGPGQVRVHRVEEAQGSVWSSLRTLLGWGPS